MLVNPLFWLEHAHANLGIIKIGFVSSGRGLRPVNMLEERDVRFMEWRQVRIEGCVRFWKRCRSKFC